MVSEWLLSESYSLEVVHDGAVGFEFLRQGHYDLVILDWDLPSMSGIDILRKYRAAKFATPVIMLTGKGQIQDKETGLDTGADDYLTKPFSMKELSARIRALLRRPVQAVSHNLCVGKLELDPIKHLARFEGKEIRLLPKDFQLLEFLMRNPDQVFSTEALLQRVWNIDTEATSDALRTAIKRIRQAINDDGTTIENVPRIGYRLRSS